MTDTTVAARVNKIIVEHLGVSMDDVRADTLLVPDHDSEGRKLATGRPDLGCDSLDIVELSMAFEEEFEIEISDDESNALNTGSVQAAYDLVESKLVARAAA